MNIHSMTISFHLVGTPNRDIHFNDCAQLFECHANRLANTARLVAEAGGSTDKKTIERIQNAAIQVISQELSWVWANSTPLGQNGCHFTDNIFRCIFVNEKICILSKISLKFVPKGPIDNYPAVV